MNLVPVDEITDGMVIAQNIYTLDDQLVLPKGTVLDSKSIKRIKNYSIFNVFIDEPENIVKSITPSKNESYAEKLLSTNEFKKFKKTLENDAKRLEKALKDSF